MAAVAAKPHVLVACALLLLAVGCQASPFWPLEIGYYHDKCPQAEAVVKGVMEKAISQNPGNGAAMIRMLFHDCFGEVHTSHSPEEINCIANMYVYFYN